SPRGAVSLPRARARHERGYSKGDDVIAHISPRLWHRPFAQQLTYHGRRAGCAYRHEATSRMDGKSATHAKEFAYVPSAEARDANTRCGANELRAAPGRS